MLWDLYFVSLFMTVDIFDPLVPTQLLSDLLQIGIQLHLDLFGPQFCLVIFLDIPRFWGWDVQLWATPLNEVIECLDDQRDLREEALASDRDAFLLTLNRVLFGWLHISPFI